MSRPGGPAGLLLLVALLGCGVARADFAYRVKIQAAAEIDSNARREEGNDRKTDGVSRFMLRSTVVHRPDPATSLSANLRFGSKLFYSAASEDVFVTIVGLGLSHRIGRRAILSVDAGVKDRHERTSETDYFTAQGGAGLRLRLHRRLDLRLRAGYGAFFFKPDDFNFSYRGDEYSLDWLTFPARRLRLSAGYSFGRRAFRSPRLVAAPEGMGLDVLVGRDRRDDQVHSLNLRVRWIRTVVLSGSYTLQAVRSNSFGFGYIRHRIGFQLSAKLPGRIFAHLRASLQLLGFNDPVFLNPTLFIDDDNRSWVAVKLSRPVGRGFALEARYSYYGSTVGSDVTSYQRHVVGFGVAYTL